MSETIIIVDEENVGKRLDVFISQEISSISRSRAKSLIEFQGVKVNELTENKPSYLVKFVDEITVEIPDAVELNVEKEDLPLDIVYQDQYLAVVNKAQGMVTHPAVGNLTGTLVNALLFHVKDLSSINGIVRPGIVHRLDRDTSGLLVIAKTDEAHVNLSAQIASKDAKRFYYGLVDGNIKEDNGIVNQPIGRSTSDRKKMAIVADGREATTFYKVIERFKKYTFVEYQLQTGRTHQIRVHSKFLGHPIVGDHTYGGSNEFKLRGQLLHAFQLILKHPISGETMIFNAPLPSYYLAVLTKLRQS